MIDYSFVLNGGFIAYTLTRKLNRFDHRISISSIEIVKECSVVRHHGGKRSISVQPA